MALLSTKHLKPNPQNKIKIIGECGSHLEMVGNHYHYSNLILQKLKLKKPIVI
jgi:hypothetical protein